jgi:hypothetical protein
MPIEYPFLHPSSDTAYEVFPKELERDPFVWFHGTARENLDSILSDSFKAKPPLESASFTSTSAGALGYACDKRSGSSPDGVVLAVRFASLEGGGIEGNSSIVHVFTRAAMPIVVGFCVVPATYRHV